MQLTHVPLLHVQRELYAMPRGMGALSRIHQDDGRRENGRFGAAARGDEPDGNHHVPALIDEYLALGAEDIAKEAVSAIARRAGTLVPPDKADFKVALVVSDDLKGGWTNRWASDIHRIEGAAITKRGWLVGILWTSEPASEQNVRDAVLTSIYRAEYLQTNAAPATLGEMLDQEGFAMARAGAPRRSSMTTTWRTPAA